jgi:hypothetical protein
MGETARLGGHVGKHLGGSSMNSSETFRRHAVECGQMANFLRNKENRAEWNSIAERYRRCAQWYDTRRTLADNLKHLRKNKKPLRQSVSQSP